MTPPTADRPLAGRTVAVTAERRREELGALLERRGAAVVYAPAIRVVPLEDDAALRAATEAVLARPIDVAVATTAVGFRGWLAAAAVWELPVVEHLRAARVLARGPKARGAIRGAGLVEAWAPASEASDEVLAHLLAGGEGPVAGRRIALQLHGDPLADVVAALRAAGAEVLPVPVYRWEPPADLMPLHGLIRSLAAGEPDAVTFTSAPAAAGLLQAADDLGLRQEVVAALRGPVLAVVVGPVTARPLTELGVPTRQPARARLADLAREVVVALGPQ